MDSVRARESQIEADSPERRPGQAAVGQRAVAALGLANVPVDSHANGLNGGNTVDVQRVNYGAMGLV